MRELLTRLADLYGASGREQDLISEIREEFKKTADEVSIDKFGNVIATKRGSGDLSVMLAAHMDEIGLAVEKVDGDGFAFPSNVGGWNPQILPSNPFRGNKCWGIASISPLGLLDKEEKKKAVKSDDLFIDGENFSRGDFLAQDASVATLGNPNLLVGKSFDDRAGVAVLIKVLEELSDDLEINVHGVATVQEEVGARGAGVAAYRLDPDLGLVLEVALADDVPMNEPHTPVVRLGKGPAITVKDASMISHPSLTNFLIKVAKEQEIPHQLEILERGGTDAGRIHISREGVPSSVIGIPTRYLHSPVEVLDFRDLERAVKLVASALENLTKSNFEAFFQTS